MRKAMYQRYSLRDMVDEAARGESRPVPSRPPTTPDYEARVLVYRLKEEEEEKDEGKRVDRVKGGESTVPQENSKSCTA